MCTNPSVSSTSPGPRAPGPPAAEHASPWESQHMCWGEAGGAGAGSGDHPALPQPGLLPARRRFTERSEWNEWGAAVFRNQAEIRRSGGAGPSPRRGGQRPLLPKKVHRPHPAQYCRTSTVPLAPGCAGPQCSQTVGRDPHSGQPGS